MGEGVTILAAVEAQVATGAVVVILVLVTVDKVVGVGVGVGVGVDDVFGGSGNAGGVPDHSTQYFKRRADGSWVEAEELSFRDALTVCY
jgi:hypothetical protein